MSVLVFVESADGIIKKSSIESICYGVAIGEEVTALAIGDIDNAELTSLGKYGASKVLHISDAKCVGIQAESSAISSVIDTTGANTLIIAKSSKSDAVGARVSIKQGASMASNVVGLPDVSNGFAVKRSIYTGKAFAIVDLPNVKKVIIVNKNIVPIVANGNEATVEKIDVPVSESDQLVKSTGKDKTVGEVLLPEAEVVVSGGRGLKGPENWGMIEELAKVLGAATGCSKPVSDLDWRPHREHVGQTGIKVSPNLYIAVGISGAIQHLAGVNSSKFIVVINTDKEAPFFKEADYGIVGDAFDIVPKLTEAIKVIKN